MFFCCFFLFWKKADSPISWIFPFSTGCSSVAPRPVPDETRFAACLIFPRHRPISKHNLSKTWFESLIRISTLATTDTADILTSRQRQPFCFVFFCLEIAPGLKIPSGITLTNTETQSLKLWPLAWQPSHLKRRLLPSVSHERVMRKWYDIFRKNVNKWYVKMWT